MIELQRKKDRLRLIITLAVAVGCSAAVLSGTVGVLVNMPAPTAQGAARTA